MKKGKRGLAFLWVPCALVDLAALTFSVLSALSSLFPALPFGLPEWSWLLLFLLLISAVNLTCYCFFALPLCPVCQRRVSLRAVLRPGAEIHCPSCSNHFSLS